MRARAGSGEGRGPQPRACRRAIPASLPRIVALAFGVSAHREPPCADRPSSTGEWVNSRYTSSSVGVRKVMLFTSRRAFPSATATALSAAGPSEVERTTLAFSVSTLSTEASSPSSDSAHRKVAADLTRGVGLQIRDDEVLADRPLELVGRTDGCEPTACDETHAVGEGIGLFEVLRREEDGHPELRIEPSHLGPDALAARRVETGRRLVQKEDLGVVHEGGGQVEPALHAPRISAYEPVDGRADVDEIEDLIERVSVSRLT